MERVALDLQTSAQALRNDAQGFDLFGRSAYNRYYYATFLLARQMMISFDPNWKGSHSSLPDQLAGTILKQISNFQRKALKFGDSGSIAICGSAKSALNDFSALLKEAYSVRVLADYYPEIAVTPIDGERFKLDRTTISSAHDWPIRARNYIAVIQRAWRLAHGNS